MGLGERRRGRECGVTKNPADNPWTVKASKLVYDNPWISLTEHDVITPSGGPGIYGLVNFKNKAIGVVPYEDGHVWMVGQYRLATSHYSWEIPEGGGPLAEDPLEAAKRELKEETGLTAESYERLITVDLSNSVTDEEAIIYLATDLTLGEAAPEDTECLQLQKMTVADIYARITSGHIRDAITVLAIYKIMLLQQQGAL